MSFENLFKQGNRPGPRNLIVMGFVFLLFLPDLDLFAISMSPATGLVSRITGLDDMVISRVYIQLVAAFMGFCVLMNMGTLLRTPRHRVIVLGAGVLIGYALVQLHFNGVAFREVLRLPPMIGIYLICMTALASSCQCRYPLVLRDIGVGLLAAALIRLIYSGLMFARYGGTQIVEGVQSFAMDGSLLILWGFLAASAGIFAIRCLERKNRGLFVICLIIAGVLSIANALSYRRAAQIWILLQFAGGSMLYFWLRRRLLLGVGIVAGVTAAIATAMISAAIVRFGINNAFERLLSLTSNSDTKFGKSNDAFIDDWQAWKVVIAQTKFLGSGMGLDYGVVRLHDIEQYDRAFSDVIPLHTGTYELWASLGILGALFHLLILVVLPIKCLMACRNRSIEVQMLAANCAAFILVVSLWPLAPPVTYSNQTAVLFGIVFGVLLAITGKPNETTERSFEHQTTVPATGYEQGGFAAAPRTVGRYTRWKR